MVMTNSCVGTVEDAAPDISSQFNEGATVGTSYNGILSATAVAHNRFEIVFDSLPDELYEHYLFVNQATFPLRIDINDPDLVDLGGNTYLYTYIQGDVSNNFNFVGDEHVFKIRARERSNEIWTINENEIQTRGFLNRVSYFDGINSVSEFAGAADSKVTIKWSPSAMEGTFVATEPDAVYYKVTYIEAEEGYENLYNPSYSGSKRFSQRVPAVGRATPLSIPSEVTISSLREDTNYLFSVRAIHKKYADEEVAGNTNISFPTEQNTRFVRYRTGVSTGLFDLDRSSLVLKNASGSSGLTSILASWSPGIGSYSSYRIYYREYTGGGDPAADDKLDLTADLIPLAGVCNTGGIIKCEQFDATDTSADILSLTAYSHYQFKLVLCSNVACNLDPLAVIAPEQAAIVTNLSSIKVEPTLAPFSGISSLSDPTDVTDLDRINIVILPASTSVGYADSLEFYCFDPADKTNHVAFPQNGSAIVSAIAECNGLSLALQNGSPLSSITANNLSSNLNFQVQGINADGTTEYCFQAIDAINNQGASNIVKQSIDSDKATCFFPRINTPSIEQFPGLKSCTVLNDEITVDWDLPSGGVYNQFKVYWKEKDAFAFSFESAISGAAGYMTHGIPVYLADNLTTLAIPDLTPGKVYDFGILSWAIGGADTPSEFNARIQTCKVEFPKATFDSWQRIFAVGPKIDGRYNLDPSASNLYSGYKASAYMPESLNSDGIPVEYDGATYVVSPGQYNGSNPTNFTDSFDGAFNASGEAYSSTGIVSLAWKDIDLSYGDSTFQTNQNFSARPSRTFGYRVYRSFNNGLDWEDLTATSGLIHAGSYTYQPRSNAQSNGNEISTRMAFFTDYSITALAGAQDVERARIVQYRVVPVYDEVELDFSSSQFNKRNIIKVIIPPANMALVNRIISNKTMCEEIGKAIDVDNNYVCEFNGLGAKPRLTPWALNETVIDQGGDLLVDRFELGCNYTRGDLSQDPELGSSWIDVTSAPYGGTYNNALSAVRDFDGLNSVNGSFMKGCFNDLSKLATRTDSSLFGAAPDEKSVLFGDCLGANRLMIARTTPGPDGPERPTFNTPGVPNLISSDFTSDAASNVIPSSPQIAFGADTVGSYSFFGGVADFRRNVFTQSEYAAVFYNQRNRTASEIISPRGPDHTDPSGVTMVSSYTGSTTRLHHQSCFINLAAIGADGAQRARWFPTSLLSRIRFENGVEDNLNDKSLGEIQGANNFYNDVATSEFKTIPSSLWNSERIDSSMKLPRIFSSNSAKLPPLQGLSQESSAKVCASYKLQVGESEDGTNFSPRSKVYNKRLLRRADFVASAAFPDTTTYNEAAIIDIEQGDSASFSNSCMSSNNPQVTQAVSVNTKATLDSKSTNNDSYSEPSAFHTGSGQTDSSGHSGNCTSKYGVQDLVGNLQETLSDRIQCDFTLDRLYFGLYDAVGGFGTTTQSVTLTNANVNNLNFWSDAKIYDQFGADITPATVRPWVRTDPNSGYCSIVDSTEAHLTNANFRTGSSFLTFDQLQTDPLYIENIVDPYAINTQRNGDGTFASFGLGAISPQLKYNNSLAISSAGVDTGSLDVARGNYFSNLLGIPLACPDSTPFYDPCGANGSDNKLLTTSFLNTRNTPDTTITTYVEFPTHNAQIFSRGVSDINDGPEVPKSWDPTVSPISGPSNERSVVTEIRLTGPTGANPLSSSGGYNLTYESRGDTGTFTGGSETYYSIGWSIRRDSQLTMDSGGSFISSLNGRYSMTNGSLVQGGQMTASGNGTRCAVLVNLDQLREGIEEE